MLTFISGAIAMGYWAAGLFFVKFYRKTKDRLFLTFGLAFWLLAVERAVLAVLQDMNEHTGLVYILRLLAFSLIIYAFIDKNTTGPAEEPKVSDAK